MGKVCVFQCVIGWGCASQHAVVPKVGCDQIVCDQGGVCVTRGVCVTKGVCVTRGVCDWECDQGGVCVTKECLPTPMSQPPY